MTGGAGRSIWWDAENRPVSITLAGITTTFAYPSNGRSDGKRVRKAETNGALVTTIVYIGNYFEETTAGAVTGMVTLALTLSLCERRRDRATSRSR